MIKFLKFDIILVDKERKGLSLSNVIFDNLVKKGSAEMIEFKNINVNPKGRKTGDCSTRALVGTLGISYDEALKLQTKWSLKTYYDPTSKQVIEKVLNEFGYVKMKQPRKYDNTKYQVKELDQILTKEQLQQGVLVTIANHHTCIKDNYIQDIWNCGRKSVGNYYVKM